MLKFTMHQGHKVMHHRRQKSERFPNNSGADLKNYNTIMRRRFIEL